MSLAALHTFAGPAHAHMLSMGIPWALLRDLVLPAVASTGAALWPVWLPVFFFPQWVNTTTYDANGVPIGPTAGSSWLLIAPQYLPDLLSWVHARCVWAAARVCASVHSSIVACSATAPFPHRSAQLGACACACSGCVPTMSSMLACPMAASFVASMLRPLLPLPRLLLLFCVCDCHHGRPSSYPNLTIYITEVRVVRITPLFERKKHCARMHTHTTRELLALPYALRTFPRVLGQTRFYASPTSPYVRRTAWMSRGRTTSRCPRS